jgi:hypothetical protein
LGSFAGGVAQAKKPAHPKRMAPMLGALSKRLIVGSLGGSCQRQRFQTSVLSS